MEYKDINIPDNVISFIEICSKKYSAFQEDLFYSNITEFIDTFQISSPIEQILYSALNLVRDINFIDSFEFYSLKYIKQGLYIEPQKIIDKFRVDFFVVYYNNISADKKELIVELDSQEWHERTEKERRYEKMRERFIVSKGYTIFRYTGKEIIDNPFGIAIEIISYVTNIPKDSLETS